MKTKLMLWAIALSLFMAQDLNAQNGANPDSKANAYGQAKSLEKRVLSMEARIAKAKVKLAEHEEKGTMPSDVIEKKKQQLAALEEKVKSQKEELSTLTHIPKPGNGKAKDKANVKPELDAKPDKDKGKGKPELDVNDGKGKPDVKPGKGKGKPELNGNKPPKPPKGKKDEEGDHDDDDDDDDDDELDIDDKDHGHGKGHGKGKAKGHDKKPK